MIETKICNCHLCQRSKKFKELIDEFQLKDNKNEKLYHFLLEILDDCVHAEFDMSYYQAIHDGSWPSENELITCWKTRLEKICEYFINIPDHERPFESALAYFMLEDFERRWPKLFKKKEENEAR